MMHCQRVQRLIGVYRELDRAERRMVDAHLRECASCRAAWSDEQRVRKYLAGIPILETPRRLQPQLLAIPATVAATPSLLAMLMRLLGVLILGFGLGSIAGDSGNEPREAMPSAWGMAPAEPPVTDASARAANEERESGQSRLAAAPQPAPVSRDARPLLETPQPTSMLGNSSAAMTGSHDDRDEDEADSKGDRAVVALPTPLMGNRFGNSPAVETAQDDAVPPTAAPPSPTVLSCAALSVQLYADVGIEGTSVDDCILCDGQLGPADRSAWLESNHALPDGLHLTIFDALSDEVLFEQRVSANGQALISLQLEAKDHPWICQREHITLRLGMPTGAFDDGWQACPRGPGHQLDMKLSEGRSANIGLTRACPTHPEPPAPEPSDEAPAPEPTATPEPAPSQIAPVPSLTPAPSATPVPTRATEEADPDPGPGSGNGPDDPGPPSGAPSPSPPGEDPVPPPADPPTPRPEPTTPGPVPPPPTDL